MLAHRVRQTGVRIARDVRVRNARHVLDEGAHLARSERAVDPDDQRPRVLDRHPEGLRRLPREIAPAPVDRGERQPERQLRCDIGRGDDRRLPVERVEDGLDEEHVHTSLGERGDLLRIARPDLVEGHGAVGRIVDLGRNRERDVERADRTCDEAGTVRRSRRPRVRGRAGEARALAAHLRREVPEVVVALPDRRRGERVRGGYVRASSEVRVVGLRDQGRPREVQEVRVALDVPPVIAEKLAAIVRLGEPSTVDEDAPRPVEHGDAPVEDLSQPFGRGHVSPSGAAFRLESPTEVRAGGSLGVW